MAGEYAVLTTGARLHAERHEPDGDKVRLFTKTGSMEIPASLVTGFEQEEVVPAPPVPASPPVSATQHPEKPATPKQLVDAAAQRCGLDARFVRSVVAAESGFRTDVVSPKGAIGLMQLMPGTAAQLGVDPHNPVQNVEAGACYLAGLLRKYDGGVYHALAAYNAGEGAVEKYKGVPPYSETRAYIAKIVGNWQKSQAAGQ